MQKHEFALYVPDIAFQSTGSLYVIRDKQLLHRIVQVLRLQPGDQCTLFNNAFQLHGKVEHVCQAEAVVLVLKAVHHVPLKPQVHWLIPLLDRQAWYDVVTTLTVLGAATIQPLITKKIRRQWRTDHDREREKRLMIAAAEQSKQFILPEIKSALDFYSGVGSEPREYPLFFDAEGQDTFTFLTSLRSQRPAIVTCMIGPEGDLTLEEKEYLKKLNFSFYRLTQSILRSELAAALGMGMIRCCSDQ